MKKTLITCYVVPDLDGYSCVVAYAEYLGKKGMDVAGAIIGEPHDEALYVINRFQLPDIQRIDNDNDYDEVILVDSSDINGLEGKIQLTKVKEIIDHRKIHEAEKFVNAKTQIELVGAAATLIAEKFEKEGMGISRNAAILLYSAIISNTLNFKGGVTTERDRKMAGWLRAIAQLPENYERELFEAKSDLEGNKLASRIEGDLAWFVFGNNKVGIAQLEIVGVEKLIKSRGQEILSALNREKGKLDLDFIFLNAIELDEGKNYFIANDEDLKAIVEKVLEVKFQDNVAIRSQLIMRKQIVPLIKEEFEKKAVLGK